MIGLSVPLPGLSLSEHRGLVSTIVNLGYRSIWASETSGFDAVTPLAAMAAWAPALRIGTSVLPVQTRGPALMAMTAAALADLGGPGTVLGLGASSPVVARDWNGRPYGSPLSLIGDTIRFLRDAFEGRPVSRDYGSFEVKNFRLGRPVPHPPDLLVAALRPRMLQVAREADGAIATMVSPADVTKLRGHLGSRARLAVWLTICPSEDAAFVHRTVRPHLAPYVCSPAYRAQQSWLGRGSRLAGAWTAWEHGDRSGALAELSGDVIDDLVVHGSPEDCLRRINQYLSVGADEVILSFDPAVCEPAESLGFAAGALRPRR